MNIQLSHAPTAEQLAEQLAHKEPIKSYILYGDDGLMGQFLPEDIADLPDEEVYALAMEAAKQAGRKLIILTNGPVTAEVIDPAVTVQ